MGASPSTSVSGGAQIWGPLGCRGPSAYEGRSGPRGAPFGVYYPPRDSFLGFGARFVDLRLYIV